MKRFFCLMAVAKGQESTEPVEIKRYIGVATVQVVAVCPDKAELEKIYGRAQEKEPEYVSTVEMEGKQVPNARIDFLLRTVPDSNNGIDTTFRMSMFVRQSYRYNRDRTKTQVIDRFGRTAWVTSEELKSHAIPKDRNGKPLQLDKDYRPCYNGEEDLMKFFKALLGIPDPMVWKNSEWVPTDHPEDCDARFDNIKAIFSGDMSELRQAWMYQQQNKVKVLVGVRTAADGRQYQTFYTRMFLPNRSISYTRLETDLNNTQASGMLQTSEFRCVPLQEYTVDSTDLSEQQNKTANPFDESPFGKPEDNPFFQ